MAQRAQRGPSLRMRAKDVYEKRKLELRKLFGEETMQDKLSFVAGVSVLLLFQAVLFAWPHRMALAYTVLVIPLLCARFLLYRRSKWHMFMLDHCYFVGWSLLQYLWFNPVQPDPGHRHLLILFALCMGPLAGGIWMWKNSLVFSDLDRFTSVFIHFVPPLVCYCIRFHSLESYAIAVPSLWEFVWRPLATYVWWQVFYLLKTEVLDRERFEEDEQLTSSLRWMTKKHPHPIYLWVVSKPWGKNVPPVFIIVTVQFIYSVMLLCFAWLLAQSQRASELWLAGLFLVATFNGGKYYLEVMAERHAKQAARLAAHEQQPPHKHESLFVISSTRARFFTFVAFVSLALGGYRVLLTRFLLN